MKPMILFALVWAMLLSGCGGGGDSGNNKAALLHHVEEGFEERGAPPQFTNCLIGRLDATLDNGEVEEAYESLTDDSAPEREVAKAVGPKMTRAIVEASFVCGKRLIKSGDFSRAELLHLFE